MEYINMLLTFYCPCNLRHSVKSPATVLSDQALMVISVTLNVYTAVERSALTGPDLTKSIAYDDLV